MKLPIHRHANLLWGLLLTSVISSGQAQQPAEHFGSAVTQPNVPKVLVFLHGATPEPRAPGDVPQPSSGTLDFARFYWGRTFVRNLLGFTQTGMKTLAGHELTNNTWDAHQPPDAQNRTILTVAVDEANPEHHFIVPGNYTGTATPPICGMLTYRDGSRGLMDQAETAINQIYDLYKGQFGSVEHPLPGRVRPSIILVCHSMGALVARVIMTAPSDPVSGGRLQPQTIEKARVLRDKVLFTISVAGPQEGSPLATEAQRILNQVNQAPPLLVGLLNLLSNNSVTRMQRMMQEELGRPSMNDLTPSIWTQLNTGVLHPSRAQRADGSLIPLYTMIGHTPAGDFYTDPTSENQWPLGGMMAESALSEAAWRNTFRSLCLATMDYLAHNLPGSEPRRFFWGRLDTPGGRFDQVARYHRDALGFDTPFTDPVLSAPASAPGFPLGYPTFYTRTNKSKEVLSFNLSEGVHYEQVQLFRHRDREVDNDGLVSVRSGAGYHLGTSTAGFFGSSEQWPVGPREMWGSWFRMTSSHRPWRYLNHEQIHRDGATGTWLRDHLIGAAGPLCTGNSLSTWPARRVVQRLTLKLLDTDKLEAKHIDALIGESSEEHFGSFQLEEEEDEDEEATESLIPAGPRRPGNPLPPFAQPKP